MAAAPEPDDEGSSDDQPAPRLRRPLLTTARAAAIAVAGTAAIEARHRLHLGRDDEHARLCDPLHGATVAPVSADGTVLHAEVFGPDDGHTFVLAPGWTETVGFFDSMTRLLVARGFRVVAYDLRGQGRSARAAGGDYTLPRYGDDLEAVLVASSEGRDDVIVAGHSMGAMSIAAWAAEHDVAARIRAAALMNTGLDGLVRATKLLPAILPEVIARPLALHAFLGNPLPMPHLSTVFGRRAVRFVAFGPKATSAQIAFTERELWDCPPSVRRAAGTSMSSMDLLDALPRITVPTLVLAGAADRLTPPRHAHRIAERLPLCAGVEVFPGIGHMGPLEAPELFVASLVALSGSVDAPARVGV